MKERIESSKMTSKGQITLPKAIREHLGLKTGDTVTFVEIDGLIYLAHNFESAIRIMQKAMEGEAEKAGLHTEEDVVKLVKEIRSKNNIS